MPDSSGKIVKVRGTVNGSSPLTRPSDTTAYTAKDAIADSTSAPHPWVFTGVVSHIGGGGQIIKAILLTSQTTNVEAFRLHLYNAAPTALNDNAACTAPLLADVASYVGTLNFPAAQTEGTGATAAYAVNAYDVLAVETAADANLYGILETPSGFTPASAQTFEILLTVVQNY